MFFNILEVHNDLFLYYDSRCIILLRNTGKQPGKTIRSIIPNPAVQEELPHCLTPWRWDRHSLSKPRQQTTNLQRATLQKREGFNNMAAKDGTVAYLLHAEAGLVFLRRGLFSLRPVMRIKIGSKFITSCGVTPPTMCISWFTPFHDDFTHFNCSLLVEDVRYNTR
jgi:hypothetical protein